MPILKILNYHGGKLTYLYWRRGTQAVSLRLE